MSTVIRLRPWQKAALEQFRRKRSHDFLAVATPGAGKTTFALSAVAEALSERAVSRVIVVAPTQHLKTQWAHAAARFRIHLDAEWTPLDGALAPDMHGVVLTYQAVATSSSVLRTWAPQSIVVLDEIHHAGDDKSWGSAVCDAFDECPKRLSLSGTPFRSDSSAIPFVEYFMDEARADFEYGYADALTDGRVVRPIYFPTFGGEMEWIGSDGSEISASFDDALDIQRSNQRLRAALAPEGNWLHKVLTEAHGALSQLRTTHPTAGGLVIAIDQEHAYGIAGLLSRISGTSPVVAVSDDPNASAKIESFAASDAPWIVAVRMVSEGVDIPRLRVGVFATNTTTELFFRQAVGRLVRWTPGVKNQKAFMYLPDDPRLRRWAVELAESRRHSLKTRADREPTEGEFDRVRNDRDEDQMSLFEVISSVATSEQTVTTATLFDVDHPENWDDSSDGDGGLDLEHVIAVPQPAGAKHVGDSGESLHARKNSLRDSNANMVAELVRYTSMDHRLVNLELNRRAGIRKISEASAAQLDVRLAAAREWLRSIR